MALLLAGLTACGEEVPRLALIDRPAGGGFLSALTQPRQPAAPQSRAALARGDVQLTAPRGWCIEPESLQARGQQGFALLVGCHALGATETGGAVPSGVLTVAVSARRAPGEADAVEALRQAVESGAVRSEDRVDDVALMRLRPRVSSDPSQLGDPVWRAVFVHEQRAISLAAYGPEGGQIAGGAGAALLLAIAKGIRGNRPE
ncbi:hypothetical protein MALG_03260 [Marinovum algicola DG 898]|jgi:hypothetical protein|uniref:hypothetical protein n=2 Tax=Marinovum TaxID=367771 RepID=UPI00065B0E6A|nr:hypothetical protein MALG_03260 [Marinovum algicola DG 898]